jgi:pilus assembly protein CpaF
MSTIHANSSRDALARIENMMLMANANLPSAAIRAQMASALDLIIQIERMRDGVRRVVEVTEVCGMEGDVLSLRTLFSFRYLGEAADGQIRGVFEASPGRPRFYPRLEYFGFGAAFLAALGDGSARA